MAPWVRVTSNGTGITKNSKDADKKGFKPKNGFVMRGADGFDNSFGVKNSVVSDKGNILGYQTDGTPHMLNLDIDTFRFPVDNNENAVSTLQPPPGITSIEASIQKERIRKVTINWQCYGPAQLEYMSAYFLTPGISVIVEFGWNNFDDSALLDLTNTDELRNLFSDGSPLYDRILKSDGKYDVTFGNVANFTFSSKDGMLYECKTDVYSKHRNHTGAFLNSAPKVSRIKEGNGYVTITQSRLGKFAQNRLKKVTQCLKGGGKNFFDKLDDSDTLNPELKSKFYGGQNEDRIFIPRGVKDVNDPFSRYTPESIDWDKNTPSSVWVTVGFVVELMNLFVTQTNINLNTTDKKDHRLYELDIDDVVIGAHPNLISSDGDFLLIPNPQAPKYNLGFKYWLEDYRKKPETKNFVTRRDPFIPSNSAFGLGNNTARFDTGSVVVTAEGEYDLVEANKNKLQHQTVKPVQSGRSDKMTDPNRILYEVFRTGFFSIDKPDSFIEAAKKYSILYNFFSSETTDFKKSDAPQIGAFRDDIDSFINRFRYASKAKTSTTNGSSSPSRSSLLTPKVSYGFPRNYSYTDFGNNINGGYWGYLKDLYVNVDDVANLINSSETVEMLYGSLLNNISKAAAGFWDLSVVESDDKLKVIDKKFMSNNLYHNMFQFEYSSDSIVKSIEFSANPTTAQLNQVVVGSSNNKQFNTGTAVSSELPDFYYGDRLRINELEPEDNKSQISDSRDDIKQYQKYGKVDGTYGVSIRDVTEITIPSSNNNLATTYNNMGAFVVKKTQTVETGYKVMNLALPNESLLLSILNDGDVLNNINIYGGQQPNFICELVLQGISGLRTFQCFSVRNLPRPYSENDVIFQIVDVTHNISDGNWTTTIKAGIRPIPPKEKLKLSRDIRFSNGKESYDKK